MNYVGKINSKHGIFNFCNSDLFIGKSLMEYGEFSEIELSVMQKFIKDGDIVMDIGANIGSFTVPFSKKVGKKGKVLAFEPQKFIFNLLSDNVKCNKLKNVQVFNNAMGHSNIFLKLNDIDYAEPGNFGGIGLGKNYDNSCVVKIKKTKKYKIKTLTLNDFLNLKKCNFVKIDVELMELDVLKGGDKFIKKYRPIMWIENHTDYPNIINDFLISNEYDSYWMVTCLYNSDNYFINSTNYFGKCFTYNSLAIPKENQEFKIGFFNKVLTPNCRPTKAFIATL